MSGYAASSAAAAQLTPFSSPHQTTNPAGLTAQDAAVTQANASAAASNPLSQAVSAAIQSLQAAANPSSIIPVDLDILDAIRVVGTSINGTFKMEGTASGIIGAEDNLGILPEPGAETAEVTPTLTAAPQLSGAASGLGGGTGLGSITATLARAARSDRCPCRQAGPRRRAARLRHCRAAAYLRSRGPTS